MSEQTSTGEIWETGADAPTSRVVPFTHASLGTGDDTHNIRSLIFQYLCIEKNRIPSKWTTMDNPELALKRREQLLHKTQRELRGEYREFLEDQLLDSSEFSFLEYLEGVVLNGKSS